MTGHKKKTITTSQLKSVRFGAKWMDGWVNRAGRQNRQTDRQIDKQTDLAGHTGTQSPWAL